jgi:pyruvate-formate lyase-activating enzyme
MQVNLGGIESFSTVDYPGHAALVVFLRGCDRRCSWCHNKGLQYGDTPVDIDIIFDLIDEASGFISAVVVSGGEPLIQDNIEATAGIVAYAKSLGLKAGVHTSYRERLKLIGPIDYALVSNPDMHPKHVEAHRAIWYDHGGAEYTTEKLLVREKIGKFAEH